MDNYETAAPFSKFEDDVFSCCQLCLPVNYLQPLPIEVRNETFLFIHELNKANSEDVDIGKCTETIVQVEKALAPEHFVCDITTTAIVDRLRKLNMLDEATEIVNNRIERLRADNIACLLTLGRLYSQSGNYHRAADPLKRAYCLAENDGNPLLLSLVLVKQACNLWHLKSPETAKQKVDLCLDSLEDCDEDLMQNMAPFTDSAYWLLDVYKSLGYIHRVLRDTSKSVDYYTRALNLVKKDKKAFVQMFKLESQIGCEYSAKRCKEETKAFCLSAYRRLKQISSSRAYMTHHPLTVIHALSRIAFSLEVVETLKEALDVREYVCSMCEKYLTISHPEVARVTADAAFLCNRLNENTKEDFYIERSKTCLEFCAETTDINFLKLHVRELSDAWYFLGKLCFNRNEFEEAERCFKKAISVDTRVYGCSHIRLSRLHKSMGYLYKRMDKFSEAANSFRKCKEINEEFNEGNSSVIEKLEREIKCVTTLQRKKYPRLYN